MDQEEREYCHLWNILSVVADMESQELIQMMKFVFGEYYQQQVDVIEKILKSKGHKIQSATDFNGSGIFEGLFSPLVEEFVMKRYFDMMLENFPELDKDAVVYSFMPFEIGASKNRIYFPRNLKNYSYISESGTPMIGSVFRMDFPTTITHFARQFVKSLGFPNEINIRNRNKTLKCLEMAFKAYDDMSNDPAHDLREAIKKREFLGNSAKPVLTKQKAINDFRAGLSVEDVRAKYRRVNGKPLAAWKAHVTMGTYDPVIEGEIVVEPEDLDIERLGEEDAKDLISSGIPVEEILETYPTSFSIHQLRAFEYWIKRKK